MTIELADFENHKIELTPEGQLKFQAESHSNVYGFDMQLFEEVDLEASKWNTKGRNIILNIVKKNADQEYWPRLTKDKIKNTHIQIDWGKWVDEDEETEAKPLGEDWEGNNMNDFGGGMGGMPGMGGMGGMPGMGGMGGMPGMGGMGGFPGMGGMGGMPGMEGFGGGDSDDDEEEEEEDGHEHGHDHGHGGHVHGENCNHEHEPAPKKNADLGDLDAEAE